MSKKYLYFGYDNYYPCGGEDLLIVRDNPLTKDQLLEILREENFVDFCVYSFRILYLKTNELSDEVVFT